MTAIAATAMEAQLGVGPFIEVSTRICLEPFMQLPIVFLFTYLYPAILRPSLLFDFSRDRP